jgi:hypothetical protein
VNIYPSMSKSGILNHKSSIINTLHGLKLTILAENR